MFDVFYSGIKPNLFAHEQAADSIEHARELSRTRYFWWVNYLSDYTGWDFLWEPVPWESAYTHTWPSQHHEYSGTFLVPTNVKDVDYKLHKEIIPLKEWRKNYRLLVDAVDFDFTWHPHPMDPPYRYVFGNQWYPANRMPTVEYAVPGATETKYIFTAQATLPKRHTNNWNTIIDCEFDYSWVPDPGDTPYIYVFGNQWWSAVKQPTVEYHVTGAVERKYMPYPRAELTVDMTNWRVPENVDVTSFDFSWRPDPGDPPYIYQFGTQHQRTGGPQYRVNNATEVKYIDQIRIKTGRVATAIVEIDHLDGNAGQIANTTRTVRYFDNYLDTLKRIAKSMPDKHEFIWICSSVCDYTDFDFSWHPEQWQATMLHVFASDGEKFGDTFFMHVPTFKMRSERLELLDWYDLNFVGTTVPRRPLPIITHNYDTHVEAVKTMEWAGPLAVFTVDEVVEQVPPVPLWREKTKTIVPLNKAASQVVVPRVAVSYVKTQLYDYPYIDKTYKTQPASLQDIVFISYDEPDANCNWQLLNELFPRAQRVHGVQGMETALEAAANVATTPWYYAVFAKTQVYDKFMFDFVPDYMQQPKHYIFNSRNTVNGLEYGHMGIVMYNCQGIRQVNQSGEFGIDYTMSFPNESIPILSCLGSFDSTAYHTWRTAFREAGKLCYFESVEPTVDGSYRLDTWCNRATGLYADWCLTGARDGVEFVNASQYELATIKQAFRWDWLRDYFVNKYGDLE